MAEPEPQTESGSRAVAEPLGGRSGGQRLGAGPVAGLVLAAGAGRRYGQPKALVEYAGQRLVDRAAATLRDGGCDPVLVVLGAAAERVGAVPGARGLVNPQWRSGMGSSLRAGLAGLASTGAVAVVVLLVDLPGVGAEAVRRVAGRAAPDALVTAGYHAGPGRGAGSGQGTGSAGRAAGAGQGTGWGQDVRWGHPVLLGRDHWPGVAELALGEAGARPYLRRHAAQVQVVPCGDVADDRDLDIPGQLPPSGPEDPQNLLPGLVD